MEKDYMAMMQDLKTGKIDKFEIDVHEFMDFQKVFMTYEHRKNIVGTAKKGGGAIYHYQKEKND